MKVLHIGKKGNLQKYSKITPFYNSCIIESYDSKLPLETYPNDADVLIIDAISPVNKEMIDYFKQLKLIHSEGVGFNQIDIQYARSKGIDVCNCAGMNAHAVGEHTIMLMLAMLKNINNNHQGILDGKQIDIKQDYMKEGNLLELSDMTVGLIGYGAIAKALARMLKVFHCTVYYYDVYRNDDEYATYLDLDTLLETCTMISLHAPVTPNTINMCNDEFFSKMKGQYLINTARGELIDEDALIKALENDQLKMCALDTLKGEPITKDHPVLQSKVIDKIILTPHIAGISASSFKRGYEMIWKNIEKLEKHEGLERVVNYVRKG